MAGLSRAALAAMVAALAVVATAAAAVAAAPDIAQMVLQPTDLPAAKVVSQRSVKRVGYIAAYQRTFQFAAPYGRSGIVLVQSEGDLASTADKATADLGVVERALASKAGRAALVAELVRSGAKAKDIKLGALRHPTVGDHAVELPIGLKVQGVPIYESLLYLRLDRVVVTVVYAGVHAVRPGESATIAHAVEPHIKQQLTPAALTPPAVTGTVDIGQTLTATAGTWTPVSPTFTYQWQRCDASGAACADIAGATAATYVVDPADAGATLKVVVTATNRFGAPTAESAVTAAVPVPPPPPQ
jgi:hypothetical protein